MTSILELNSHESKLNYIQCSAPSVFERIQSELYNEANELKNTILNRIIIYNAVLEAFEISGNDAIITGYINDAPVIEKYLTKKSTAYINGKFKVINDWCFSNCSFLKTIIFEEGVECIKESAVQGNSLIESIVFPKSLKYISNCAFMNCKKLSNVTFLNSNTWIAPRAFVGTKWFESMTEDFVVVNGQLLKYNGNEENIMIPEGIVNISDQVFYGSKSIKTVICPSTLEGIWTLSFADCTNLQKVILNDNLKIISIGAFEGCSNLNEISLPKSLEVLGSEAFGDNTVISFFDNNINLTKHIKENYTRYIVIK